MSPEIKLVTIGAGYFSQFQYAAWQRLGVEIVAVADRQRELAENVARLYSIARTYTDVKQMLEVEKPNLLDIITPPDTHLAFVEMAAAGGCDVICQKPFTRSLDQARQAVAIAEQAGIRLVVHENFRFQPWYREIARLLQQQRLGDLYGAQFRLRPGDGQGERAYLDRQPGFQKMPRFLINETAVHIFDVFRFLFGEVSAVYANLQQLNPVIAGEDAGQVLMEFEQGLQAQFDGNRLADHAAANRRLTMGELRIEGSTGELMLDGNARIQIRRHDENSWQDHDYDWQNIDFGGDCVYRLQQHVIEHINRGQPLENSAADYLQNLAVVEAVYQSAASGRRVEIARTTSSEPRNSA